jgi:hypothetical protein
MWCQERGDEEEDSKLSSHIYLPPKPMRPVETVSGMGEENGGGENSSMTYLIYCKNFYKCYNVTPPTQHNNKKTFF